MIGRRTLLDVGRTPRCTFAGSVRPLGAPPVIRINNLTLVQPMRAYERIISSG